MIQYGNCTYESGWQGATDRYLRWTIVENSEGHGICLVNGLADNKQTLTSGIAYTVTKLPVTSLRDAVAITDVGKWSISYNSNELKFTPNSGLSPYVGDLVSIAFAI